MFGLPGLLFEGGGLGLGFLLSILADGIGDAFLLLFPRLGRFGLGGGILRVLGDRLFRLAGEFVLLLFEFLELRVVLHFWVIALDFIAQFLQLFFGLGGGVAGEGRLGVASLRRVLERGVFQLLAGLFDRLGGLVDLRSFGGLHGILHALREISELFAGLGELLACLGEILAVGLGNFFLMQGLLVAIDFLARLLDQLACLFNGVAGIGLGGGHILAGL